MILCMQCVDYALGAASEHLLRKIFFISVYEGALLCCVGKVEV